MPLSDFDREIEKLSALEAKQERLRRAIDGLQEAPVAVRPKESPAQLVLEFGYRPGET